MSTRDKTEAHETHSVTRQGGIVAAMTLLSRIAGFVRDIVLANFLGASGLADAFFVAFRIPNFFRRLFAEGAFNQAFVPVLMRYRERGFVELQAFVAVIGGNLAIAVSLLVVLGMVFAPAVTMVFAPGFIGTERFDLTAELLRITFPYLGFISLVAFSASILNAHHRYAIAAFTPILLNFSLLLAIWLGSRYAESPIHALAWGVFAAGFVQWVFLQPAVRKLDLLVLPRPGLQHAGARQVGRLLVPAILAASVGQINALVDSMLASTLVVGSVSWLYYADRLLELPVGLVAVALGTVLLPNLSRLDARGQVEAFARLLDWGLSLGLLLAVPAAVALYVLGGPLLAALFHHGAMTAHDVVMASLALQAFSAGLIPMVMVKVLAPAYFARQDTRTPFRIAMVSIAVNVIGNLAVFQWFGHVGLALVTSLSAWVNAYLLLRVLVVRENYRPGPLFYGRALRVFGSAMVMGSLLMWLVPSMSQWIVADQTLRAGWIVAAVGGGGVVYLLMLFVLGFRPRDFVHRA